ncbi:MAG: tRNA(Met) cytidine acetyltransferase [Crenarchaeota archaeon]|nr:tRNA(Met) cytidine acetyltransferase [Thermoproteota archaeon]
MIREFLEDIRSRNSRGLLVIDHRDVLDVVRELPPNENILILTERENLSRNNIDVLPHSMYIKVLGREYDHAIIDLTGKYRHLRPNMLCAVAETIRAGGLLTILLPDLERSRLGVYGYRYDKYIKNSFRECESHLIIHNEDIVSRRVIDKKLERNFEKLTEDQRNLLSKLEEFYENPDMRILAVKGGRGRGKTYILGYLSYILHRKYNVPTIDLVTEDLPRSFIEGLKNISEEKVELYRRFIKVGKLTIRIVHPSSRTTSPIVLIDEASRIGTSRIRRIVARSFKIIMTLTTFGYEGCGRFFEHFIDDLCRKYGGLVIDFKEPVRYCKDDPLEKWINKIFVLDYDKSIIPKIDIDWSRTRLKIVNKDLLLRDVEYFRAIVRILRDAHYRHSPDDIETILDSDDHILVIYEQNGIPVAACHVRREHATKREVRKAMSGTVLRGLSTITILSRYGTQNVYKLSIWRIHRIAVRIDLQRRGIGSSMLREIENIAKENNVDVLSALFSRNEVTHFWLRNGYMMFYISPRYNKVTGEHNIGVLKILSEKGRNILVPILQDFKRRLVLSASSIYRELDSEILAEGLKSLSVVSPLRLSLSSLQERRLRIFLENFDRYDVEYVQDIVYMKLIEYLLNNEKINISDLDLVVLVCKFLQGKSVKDVAASINTCEDSAKIIVKNVVKRFLAQVTA